MFLQTGKICNVYPTVPSMCFPPSALLQPASHLLCCSGMLIQIGFLTETRCWSISESLPSDVCNDTEDKLMKHLQCTSILQQC